MSLNRTVCFGGCGDVYFPFPFCASGFFTYLGLSFVFAVFILPVLFCVLLFLNSLLYFSGLTFVKLSSLIFDDIELNILLLLVFINLKCLKKSF